jgi:hypothetical protein
MDSFGSVYVHKLIGQVGRLVNHFNTASYPKAPIDVGAFELYEVISGMPLAAESLTIQFLPNAPRYAAEKKKPDGPRV